MNLSAAFIRRPIATGLMMLGLSVLCTVFCLGITVTGDAEPPRHPDQLPTYMPKAEDSPAVGKLRDKLAKAEAEDAEFAQKLREEWKLSAGTQHAESGGIVNSVTGTVSGKVVQARDVQGGISL